MAVWNFPPVDEVDYLGAIERLATETVAPVKNQHIVSKSILKGFAAQSANRGWVLGRYDKVLARELDPKGLNACGKFRDFILYASGSAEQLWQGVENRLGSAISSAASGSLHDNEEQLNTIKDAIALHLVRSPRYRRIHEASLQRAIERTRTEFVENRRPMLEREFRRRHGLEAGGKEALNLLMSDHFRRWEEHENTGALLRITAENTFFKIRAVFSELSVQVLHAPFGRELIVSDAPAFTFRYTEDLSIDLQMAIGDSHGAGMPLSRNCFVSIAPEAQDEEISPDIVRILNRIQIETAERQLYYYPRNALAKEALDFALNDI